MGLLRHILLPDPSQPETIRKLAYWEWGEPANPKTVICLHGLTRNGRDFDFLARHLSERYRVICPDMAGRGQSDTLSVFPDYNYGTYLFDCYSLLGQLKLSAIDWIGTSMGGIIGMMIAAQQPQLIKRLVLNDVGSIMSSRGLRRILNYSGAPIRLGNEAEAMQYLKTTFASFGITTDEEWKQMFLVSFRPAPDGGYLTTYDPGIGHALRAASAKDGEIADVDLSETWNKVICPVLILRGKESDILTAETAQTMIKREAPTQLVEFENTGHAPALLNAEQINVISHWLQ